MRTRSRSLVQTVQGGMSLLDRRTRTVLGSYLLTAERAALADTCSAFKEAVLEASCLWTEISVFANPAPGSSASPWLTCTHNHCTRRPLSGLCASCGFIYNYQQGFTQQQMEELFPRINTADVEVLDLSNINIHPKQACHGGVNNPEGCMLLTLRGLSLMLQRCPKLRKLVLPRTWEKHLVSDRLSCQSLLAALQASESVREQHGGLMEIGLEPLLKHVMQANRKNITDKHFDCPSPAVLLLTWCKARGMATQADVCTNEEHETPQLMLFPCSSHYSEQCKTDGRLLCYLCDDTFLACSCYCASCCICTDCQGDMSCQTCGTIFCAMCERKMGAQRGLCQDCFLEQGADY
jgi:hypothetical protein